MAPLLSASEEGHEAETIVLPFGAEQAAPELLATYWPGRFYPGLLVLEGLPSVLEAEWTSEPAPDSEAVRAPAADRACARGG